MGRPTAAPPTPGRESFSISTRPQETSETVRRSTIPSARCTASPDLVGATDLKRGAPQRVRSANRVLLGGATRRHLVLTPRREDALQTTRAIGRDASRDRLIAPEHREM